MFKRIKNLWFLSGIDFNDKESHLKHIPITSVEGIKRRTTARKLAKIIDVDEEEQFPLKNESL